MLDLGAGTGKLTTRLVERGLEVVAVDPIPEMLELLSNSLPDTPALLGTAEEIPLPDDSVDAVLVAQAWHWFDTERAVKEVARVLRPGGRLGLVWNARDERLGWVKDLGTIIGHENAQFNDETALTDVFTDVEHHRVDWTSYLTPQALIDLVASRSYCITSPEKVRSQHARPGPRAAGHPSRAGQLQRPRAAVRDGVHPRDAVLDRAELACERRRVFHAGRRPAPDRSTNRRGSDGRERRGEREIVVQRANFDTPNDRGQCQGGLEHGEVITDT